MELKDYLKIISQKFWILVVVTIIAGAATYLFSVMIPTSYDGVAYINVAVKSQNQGDYYQYDNYYSIQASSLFADTIALWLQDPANASQIYKEAGIDLSKYSLKNLQKLFQIKRKPPATVVITLNNSDKDKTEFLIARTINLVESQTKKWADEELVKNAEAVTSAPVVLEHKMPILLNTILGLIGGFILGLAVVFLAESLNKK